MEEIIVRGLNFVPLFSTKRSKEVRRTIRIRPNHNVFSAKAVTQNCIQIQ